MTILLQLHGQELSARIRRWCLFLCDHPVFVIGINEGETTYIHSGEPLMPSRFSYDMLRKTGEFVINLTTEKLAYATDYCGVRSGRDVDKFKEMKLTKEKADFVKVPMIAESPVSIECKVRQVLELGSHHMFLADVLAVHADPQYMDEKKKFHLNDAKPLVYSHGEYLGIGKKLGTFGYSVKKKKKKSGKKKQ